MGDDEDGAERGRIYCSPISPPKKNASPFRAWLGRDDGSTYKPVPGRGEPGCTLVVEAAETSWAAVEAMMQERDEEAGEDGATLRLRLAGFSQ